MNPNANIGIVTPEIQKEIIDLNAELKSKQVDIDFFGTGIPYLQVQERSANHLLGNSAWKKVCKEKFGEEMFNQYVEKYDNKSIDLKLCGLVLDPVYSKHFNKGDKISITSQSGKNAGKFPVMDRAENVITVMLPFTGTDTGSIINLSKLKGATKKSNLINNRLSQLVPPQTANGDANSILSAPNTAPETQPEPPPTEPETLNPKPLIQNPSIMKTVITILVVAALAYGGYKAYQYFQDRKPA